MLNTLAAVGRPRAVAVGTATGVAVNVVLNIVLIHLWGTVGAALATTVAYGCLVVIASVLLPRNMAINYASGGTVGILVAGLLCAAIAVNATRFPVGSFPWVLVTVLAVGGYLVAAGPIAWRAVRRVRGYLAAEDNRHRP